MELGVALWLCPRKGSNSYDKLSTLMGSLQTLFPGSASSFEPHITITTNISIDLNDSEKVSDDVDRILSASAVALRALPKDHPNLITLCKLNSQRKYFKKLYFEVRKDPSLISFSRIIRELFVILPSKIGQENLKLNPHLYTTDNYGNVIKKVPKKHKRDEPPQEYKPIDMEKVSSEATAAAAEWSINEFDPHLSLVYSDIYPIDSALWRTIKTRIYDYLNIEDCDSENVDTGLGWDGGVLKLVLCEGAVSEWITLGSVDIH